VLFATRVPDLQCNQECFIPSSESTEIAIASPPIGQISLHWALLRTEDGVAQIGAMGVYGRGVEEVREGEGVEEGVESSYSLR